MVAQVKKTVEHEFKVGPLNVHSIFSPIHMGIKNYFEYSVSLNQQDVTLIIAPDVRDAIENEIERLNQDVWIS